MSSMEIHDIIYFWNFFSIILRATSHVPERRSSAFRGISLSHFWFLAHARGLNTRLSYQTTKNLDCRMVDFWCFVSFSKQRFETVFQISLDLCMMKYVISNKDISSNTFLNVKELTIPTFMILQCSKCFQPIEQGDVRVSKKERAPNFDGEIDRWHHVKCFFSVRNLSDLLAWIQRPCWKRTSCCCLCDLFRNMEL